MESEETDASDSSEDSLWTEDEAETEDAGDASSCLSGVEHGKEEEEKEDEYWKFVQISHEHRTQLKSSKTRAARGKSS